MGVLFRTHGHLAVLLLDHDLVDDLERFVAKVVLIDEAVEVLHIRVMPEILERGRHLGAAAGRREGRRVAATTAAAGGRARRVFLFLELIRIHGGVRHYGRRGGCRFGCLAAFFLGLGRGGLRFFFARGGGGFFG